MLDHLAELLVHVVEDDGCNRVPGERLYIDLVFHGEFHLGVKKAPDSFALAELVEDGDAGVTKAAGLKDDTQELVVGVVDRGVDSGGDEDVDLGGEDDGRDVKNALFGGCVLQDGVHKRLVVLYGELQSVDKEVVLLCQGQFLAERIAGVPHCQI